MSDSTESRTDMLSYTPVNGKQCGHPAGFFELAILNIEQPCDNQPRWYWQAANPIDGFLFIANKGRCTMKVTIAQARADRPHLTDTILPCQSKLFSSNLLMGFTVECLCLCDPTANSKCLGEAIVIVKTMS